MGEAEGSGYKGGLGCRNVVRLNKPMEAEGNNWMRGRTSLRCWKKRTWSLGGGGGRARNNQEASHSSSVLTRAAGTRPSTGGERGWTGEWSCTNSLGFLKKKNMSRSRLGAG